MTSGERVRLKLTVHYDGAAFHGWQVQPEQRTVQGELEAAARRLTGARRTVTGSGRTDRGVHATGQVASLLVPDRWTAPEFRRAMNAVLPRDIWLVEAREVPRGFHPRYDAVARTYAYRVGFSPRAFSPFHRPWCWALEESVDQALLGRCAQVIEGAHSFRSFAKAGQEERGDRCVVENARWESWALGSRLVITADRYLHHMVRYLVGTMVDVARGRRAPGELPALLAGSDPTLETSPPAPPEGLFLIRVRYPDDSPESESPSLDTPTPEMP